MKFLQKEKKVKKDLFLETAVKFLKIILLMINLKLLLIKIYKIKYCFNLMTIIMKFWKILIKLIEIIK